VSDKISKLIIENFRGATTKIPFEFDSSKNLVVIFGENGTGKSTIVDSLDFVFNNNFGSLEEMSLGTGAKKHELIASLGKQANTVKVEVAIGANVLTAVIGSGNKPNCGNTSNTLRVDILRKNKLLEFIIKQPKERYDALKSFLDFPKYSKNEQSLRLLITSQEKEYENLIRDLVQAEQFIESTWKSNGSLGGDCKSWVTTVISKDISAMVKSEEDYAKIILSISQYDANRIKLQRIKEELNTAEEVFNKKIRELDNAYFNESGQ